MKVTPYGGVDASDIVSHQQLVDKLILEALSNNRNLANMTVLARITLFIAGIIGIDKIIFGDKSAGDIRNKPPGDSYYDVLLLPVRLFTGKESIYSKLVIYRDKTLIYEHIKKTPNSELIKEYSGKTINEYYEGKEGHISPNIPENLITDQNISTLSRVLYDKITYQRELEIDLNKAFIELPIDESKLNNIIMKQSAISNEIERERLKLTNAIIRVNRSETNANKLTDLIINKLFIGDTVSNSIPDILDK